MKSYWIYIFEDGYRTGSCRLTPQEVKVLEKKHGEIMKKIEA